MYIMSTLVKLWVVGAKTRGARGRAPPPPPPPPAPRPPPKKLSRKTVRRLGPELRACCAWMSPLSPLPCALRGVPVAPRVLIACQLLPFGRFYIMPPFWSFRPRSLRRSAAGPRSPRCSMWSSTRRRRYAWLGLDCYGVSPAFRRCTGWWSAVGGWWLVVGGWWLVVGGAATVTAAVCDLWSVAVIDTRL